MSKTLDPVMSKTLDLVMLTSLDPIIAGLLGEPTGWLGLAAGQMSKFLHTTKKVAGMPEDEEWEANVKFVRELIGDVEVELLPVEDFHSGCAMQIFSDSATVTSMDEAMQAAMMQSMEKVTEIQRNADPKGYISWKTLQSCFDGDLMFHPAFDEDTTGMSHFTTGTEGWPSLAGARNASAEELMTVEQELQNFVCARDPKIWEELKIDRQAVGKMFGQKGAGVDNFLQLFVSQRKQAAVAMDVGAVRFPSAQDPYFKIYRFRVVVTNCRSRIVLAEKNEGAVIMSLTTRKYLMSDAWKSQFDEPVRVEVRAAFGDFIAKLRSKQPEAPQEAAPAPQEAAPAASS